MKSQAGDRRICVESVSRTAARRTRTGRILPEMPARIARSSGRTTIATGDTGETGETGGSHYHWYRYEDDDFLVAPAYLCPARPVFSRAPGKLAGKRVAVVETQ